MLGTLAPVEIPDPVFFHAARTGRKKSFRVHPVKRRRCRLRSGRRKRKRLENRGIQPTRDRLLTCGGEGGGAGSPHRRIGRGCYHPPPFQEPYVHLSAHTARAFHYPAKGRRHKRVPSCVAFAVRVCSLLTSELTLSQSMAFHCRASSLSVCFSPCGVVE